MKLIDLLLGFFKTGFPLDTDSIQINDLELPSKLSFAVSSMHGGSFSPLVSTGDEIKPGQPLWKNGLKEIFPSPVSGKVAGILNVPNVRGQHESYAIQVEPSSDTKSNVLTPLDPENISSEAIIERVKISGIQTGTLSPQPLADLFAQNNKVDTLVITALDNEPGVSSSIQLFRERRQETGLAAKLFTNIQGIKNVYLVLPESMESDGQQTSLPPNVNILSIKPQYPESLESSVLEKIGAAKNGRVITLEAALATLDAIRDGKLQDKKVITVIGSKKETLGNYRVPLGTSFEDIFSQLNITPKDGDKIVAGGPMRGFAQYSVDGAVDAGIDSLMIIPKSSIIEWSDEPCINCGDCIDVCPVNLQVPLINRYSEFGLFDRADALEVDQCIECGLCATVCIARRPLVQLITLAKSELAKDNKDETKNTSECASSNQPTSAVSANCSSKGIIANIPKFSVSFAPHIRSSLSITKTNLAFIFALLPAILVSASLQFVGSNAAKMNAALGPIDGTLKTVVVELGLDSGFLWFSGVLSMVVFGLGLGFFTEYICQVLMKQPRHAINGHGALIGLLIVMFMPPTIPWWVLMIAIIVAIFVGKQLFGGLGGYPMHPAMVGWLIVLLSWQYHIYPIGMKSIAATNTSVIILTAIGGIVLWLRGYIRIQIPFAVLASVLVFSYLFKDKLSGDLIDQILTGHVVLTAFFLATDTTTSPANKLAQWFYGIGMGFLIVLIRAFGIWPDAIPFAVLLMNVMNPLIDRLKPRVEKVAI
jgi:Na+-translocating ferredoxin:NAD+ oxidoreductase subunit C